MYGYTERPILALGSAWEASEGLIWVDFNLVMSQQTPIRWALNSWAALAYYGHPLLWVQEGADPQELLGRISGKELCRIFLKQGFLNPLDPSQLEITTSSPFQTKNLDIASKGLCSHQCGFFHESLHYLMWWIFWHTLSSWMVSHQCGFFHGSSY